MAINSSFVPIRNLPPLNNGGSIARIGFSFQDHVAVGFCLDLFSTPELLEVWCETQDDITLIWRAKDGEEVEFIQVKGSEFDHLWSVAELCKREKTTLNPDGYGTSILERSLAHDRCAEKCRFRMITSWEINKDLKVLSIPLSSPERALPNKLFEKTSNAVKDKVGGYISHKGHDSYFWLQNLWWQVEHSEKTVTMENLVKLMAFIESQGLGISLENVMIHIYPKLLGIVQDAGKANWSIDPEKKKVKKIDFERQLQNIVNDAGHLALGSSGKKLREKMLDKALLPESYFESAIEERRKYKQEVLQPNYLDLTDKN
jgi:hypothetical protein